MDNKVKGFTASLVLASVIFTGCANTQIANTDALTQQAKQLARSSEISPQEAILQAVKKIKSGQADELHFFAPLHLEAAQEALSEAQALFRDGAVPALVLEQTFKIDSLLAAAYKNKTTVLSTLEKALAHKEILEELKAPETLPSAYQDVVEDLEDLIKELEGGFIDKAVKGQPKLLVLMTEVEINTLKKQHLSQAQSMIDKAESVDADDYAEKTFTQAEQLLERAEWFIEKNYRDREGVRQNGLDALNAAAHAYYVAKEGQALIGLDEEDVEKTVLYFESLLARVNQSLGIENLNTMSLYDQSVVMAAKIESLVAANARLASAVNDVVAEQEVVPIVETVAEQVVEEQQESAEGTQTTSETAIVDEAKSEVVAEASDTRAE